ncbi:MAG: hypothetical protein ABFC96_10420 [Thermoguttaceae bacterium]
MNHINESSGLSSGQAGAEVPSERWTTEEMLAAFLVRILGIYFTVYAIVSILGGIGEMESSWVRVSSTGLLWWYGLRLVSPFVTLMLAVYLLLGGQWVFNRLLTPIMSFPRSCAGTRDRT